MRYRFIAVYEIIGVHCPGDGQEQELLVYSSDSARAIIYPDMDGRLFEYDRALVIGNMMLGALFKKTREGTFDERLARDLADLRKKRREEAKERLFVLFEAEGEAEPFSLRIQREVSEYIIAMGKAPKDAIRAKHRPQVNGLLASIAIGSERITGIKEVRDGVIFTNENDKPVYTYDIKTSGKLTVKLPLDDAMFDFARDNTRIFAKHRDLVNPARLLTKSLDIENDGLLSFLSAWSGLEMFTNRCFLDYENSLFEKLSAGETPMAPAKFVGRIREVMKDKYGLSDKFALISGELDGASAEADLADFRRIKGVRDNLIHGEDVPSHDLPTRDVARLLRKYLKLHVEHLKLRK